MYIYLAYAGTLPFIAASLLLALDVQAIPVLGDVGKILSSYALAIISFVAGSHWGKVLSLGNRFAQAVLLISNCIVVIAWLGFLSLPLQPLIILFIVAFLGLAGIDKILLRNGLINRDYFQTRLVVSAIVVIALAVAGVMA